MLYDYSGCYAKGGEGTTVYPAFLYHHEMPLVPMYDVGKIGFVAQLLPGKFYADRPQTDTLGRIADAQQRNPLPRNVASFPQSLQRIPFAVKLRDDFQARRAAVHCVELGVVRERHWIYIS